MTEDRCRHCGVRVSPIWTSEMSNVLQIPTREQKDDFLSSFTLDTLTEILGFANGALPLRQAGYVRLRDIYRADPGEIRRVRFIGKLKYLALVEFFQRHGYQYPPSSDTKLIPFKPLTLPHRELN